jgi:RNA polymerase sigma factor (sigma-70 family)
VTIANDGAVLRQLNALYNIGVTRELTDGQLLERFSTGPSEAAELAFEALVQRHGAMVLRVCRAQLADSADIHDAFQATFLILVEKACKLWIRDSLGPWLHQVAFRTSSCARSAAARRRKHELRAAEMASGVNAREHQFANDQEHILHEEINKLPEHYRIPIVLCDLEGCTCDEVARRMGRSVGTVKSWRSRGRERLRTRLVRRGLAPSAALGAASAQAVSTTMVPEGIARLALSAFSARTTTGEVPASVHALIKGVLKVMLFRKLETASVVFTPVFLIAGLVTFTWFAAADSQKPVDRVHPESALAAVDKPRPTAGSLPETDESWSLTLRQAIYIGLDNADNLRVISFGTPTKITALKAVDLQQFKADVTAKVRSIEQQYWRLVQAHAQVDATKKAAELAEEILEHERAQFAANRAMLAYVGESTQRVAQFKSDLATRRSDAITTERELRKVLGLPPVDGRRIVPVTAPVEARLDPNWDTALAAMLKNQPEIVQGECSVKQAEASTSGTVDSRLTQLKGRQDALKSVVHQATHSLARQLLEIDAYYKQFAVASRLRADAANRLDAKRAEYKNGQITIGHLLDFVGQYAAAVATQAQYIATYNVAITTFEEATGTLLDHDQIAVVDGPHTAATSAIAPSPPSEAPASPCKAPAPPSRSTVSVPPSAPANVASDQPLPSPVLPAANPFAGKSFSFDLTVGIGSVPIQIRGSFTVTPVNAPKVE